MSGVLDVLVSFCVAGALAACSCCASKRWPGMIPFLATVPVGIAVLVCKQHGKHGETKRTMQLMRHLFLGSVAITVFVVAWWGLSWLLAHRPAPHVSALWPALVVWAVAAWALAASVADAQM